MKWLDTPPSNAWHAADTAKCRIVYFIICFSVEHFDCLQVDLTKHDKKTDPLAIHSDNFIHNSSQKPEIVIIGGMEERTFNMEMKAVMRRLGYNGFLEDVRRGKGTGVFIRNDKLKRKQHLPATVFSFTLRNPLFWYQTVALCTGYLLIISYLYF